MEEIKETGGARIGMASATWPFATLTVDQNKLQLNATIIGNLIFKPTDIISIEPYSAFLSSGIKINHKVPGYKNKVIFWTFGNPWDLIKRIEQTGFLSNRDPMPSALEEKILKTQLQGGFPIKTSAAVAIVLIWNILFFIDSQKFFNGQVTGSPLGIGAQLALGFVLFISVLLLTFEPARRLILKEGRTIDDIKKFIYFIMAICGFMLLIISLMPN